MTVATAGANAKLLKGKESLINPPIRMEPRMRILPGSRAFIDQDTVRAEDGRLLGAQVVGFGGVDNGSRC
ncbi:MAG: hypothetical protein OSJ51_11850 [Parabacteroides distasonis]|nr:hypothetical protein [Parabacteroides distasonis]